MIFIYAYIYIYIYIYTSTSNNDAESSRVSCCLLNNLRLNQLQRSLLNIRFAKDYTRIDTIYIYNIDRWIYR